MQHGRSPAWMRAARCTTLVPAALLTLTLSNSAIAQDAASSGGAQRASPQPYTAVVTANSVNIRTGPSAQTAYVFGKLRSGDMVNVVSEDFGWALVRTAGPAFSGMEAYVPADRRVTVQGDASKMAAGTTLAATISERTEIRAPNLDAGATPDKSWKQIGTLEPGTPVIIQGVTVGEKEAVYKIALPASADGWVNMQFLRHANPSETAMHTAALAAPRVSAPPAVPAAAAPAAPAPTAAATESTPAARPVGAPALTAVSGGTGSPAIPPLMGERTSPAAASGGLAGAPTAVDAPRTVGIKSDSHGEGSVGAPVSHRAPLASEIRRANWNDLEAQWQAVRKQPQATAELDALRGQYAALAMSAPEGTALALMASARSQQLELMQEAQRQSQALTAVKSTQSERSQAMMQLILDIQRRAEYTAVGILNASIVYDGKLLPQLYRITDPQTSQTISYVLPNEAIAMGPMLGTLVGVKGGKEFDSALNINVIAPQVVELLTVRDTPQVTKVEPKTDAAKPATGLAEKVPAPVQVPAPAQLPEPDGDCEDELPPLFEPVPAPGATP